LESILLWGLAMVAPTMMLFVSGSCPMGEQLDTKREDDDVDKSDGYGSPGKMDSAP
jgi:hypothetical protein